jgi:tripartite ATP-independent transporter DctM subunit
MTPLEIGIAGGIILFVLIALGLPIGVSMGAIGVVGLALITNIDAALSRLAQTAYSMTANYITAVIPLFVIMGEFAFVSGLTKEAYAATYKWLGRLPGGLAMATIGGCAGFAAVCGSSEATALTIGSFALPEMRQHRYDPRLALGSIAAGGTLGILIPPSMAFVLYGLITEQSIGKLFLAGVFPGILLASLFLITIYILTKINPSYGPPGGKTSFREKLTAFKDVWGVLILFIVVMGGIYGGVLTPTEAAAAGAFSAFLIALFRRKLNKKNLVSSFMNTLRVTGFVFVIIIGAVLFGYLMAASGVSIALANFVSGLPVSSLGILISILVLYLILGCLMDAFAMVLVTMPILYPVIINLGYDPIWFGVLIVIMMEMGMITPPIGMNVFVLRGISRDIPMYMIFEGALPFVISMAICVAILIAFPDIALFLPNAMKR